MNLGKILFDILIIVSSLYFVITLLIGFRLKYKMNAAAIIDIQPTGPSISDNSKGMSID